MRVGTKTGLLFAGVLIALIVAATYINFVITPVTVINHSGQQLTNVTLVYGGDVHLWQGNIPTSGSKTIITEVEDGWIDLSYDFSGRRILNRCGVESWPFAWETYTVSKFGWVATCTDPSSKSETDPTKID